MSNSTSLPIAFAPLFKNLNFLSKILCLKFAIFLKSKSIIKSAGQFGKRGLLCCAF